MKLPTTRKPASGHVSMAYGIIGIRGSSTAVWSHPRYASSAVLLPLFSLTSLLIAVAVAALTVTGGVELCAAPTFLTPRLARPAVLPAGDLGVRRAIAARRRLNAPPTPGALAVRVAARRPSPSYAATLRWRAPIPGAKVPIAGLAGCSRRPHTAPQNRSQMTPQAGEHYDLIVLGAGSGGYVAGIRAAQLGMTVGIVEERYWGGVCLNTGCVPSKALLRNAEIASIITHQSATFGISGDISLDYARAVSRSREVAEARVRGVHFLLRKNTITEIEGHGQFTSPHSLAVDLRCGRQELTDLRPRRHRDRVAGAHAARGYPQRQHRHLRTTDSQR